MATTITAITATSAAAEAKGAKQFQGLFECIPFVVTLEDDTLPAQQSSQVDVTVTGAALGDFVLIGAGVDSAGGILVGAVTAANTVTVTLFNTEGSDALTAFATPTEARGLVLKTRDIVWDGV